MAEAEKEKQTDEKVHALQEQLEAVGAYDYQKHDIHALRRFLKARNGDVEAAKRMWLANLEWRESFGADSMLEKDIMTSEKRQRLLQLFPHGLYGVDLEGRPILIYRLGATNMSALTHEFPELLLQKFHVQMYEFIMRVAMPAASLAAGRHIDKILTIFDLQGMGIWDMNKIRSLLLPTMSITRDNYPETLGKVIIINAPAIFDGAYQMGKRMLTPDTQSKIEVCGKSYQTALLNLVDKSQLPSLYGGSSEAKLEDNPGPWQNLMQKKKRQQNNGESPPAGSPRKQSPRRPDGSSRAPGGGDSAHNITANSASQVRFSLNGHSSESLAKVPAAGPSSHSQGARPLAEPGLGLGVSAFAEAAKRTSVTGYSGDGESFVDDMEHHLSAASFHTCLSVAESSSLNHFLARPSHFFAAVPESALTTTRMLSTRASEEQGLVTGEEETAETSADIDGKSQPSCCSWVCVCM